MGLLFAFINNMVCEGLIEPDYGNVLNHVTNLCPYTNFVIDVFAITWVLQLF